MTLKELSQSGRQSRYYSLALSERCQIENARHWSEICRVLTKAEKCGCEYCKEVSRIFDGRQRIAELA